MALVQPVNTIQIQSKIDDFANGFISLYDLAADLVAFNANLTSANPMIVGLNGQAMDDATMTELRNRIAALQTFITWATTGGASAPLTYLRNVKRSV
jgi:hypothetical protein